MWSWVKNSRREKPVISDQPPLSSGAECWRATVISFRLLLPRVFTFYFIYNIGFKPLVLLALLGLQLRGLNRNDAE